MSTFRIKVGDRAPAFRTVLIDNGSPYPIPEGATVRFVAANGIRRRTTKRFDGEAAIIDGDNGVVEYVPETTDVDLVGHYAAEWEVTPNGGDPVTFPDDGYDRVIVAEDLDA